MRNCLEKHLDKENGVFLVENIVFGQFSTFFFIFQWKSLLSTTISVFQCESIRFSSFSIQKVSKSRFSMKNQSKKGFLDKKSVFASWNYEKWVLSVEKLIICVESLIICRFSAERDEAVGVVPTSPSWTEDVGTQYDTQETSEL